MAVKFTRRAERDLVECLIYGIETFGTAQADAYLDDLYRCFELIARHPRIGRARHEIRPRLRTHHHGRHTIVYCMESDGDVLLVAIIRDGADLDRHLRAIDIGADQ